jgi:hypothetical protein
MPELTITDMERPRYTYKSARLIRQDVENSQVEFRLLSLFQPKAMADMNTCVMRKH